MRVSTRLVSNAATTHLRQGTTFLLGLFTTWYVLGAVGVIGFGLIALAVSGNVLSNTLEMTFRFGLVREMAAAIASGESRSIRRSLTSAFKLCLQVAVPLAASVVLLAASAWAGFFNTPPDRPELRLALAILILSEGVHAGVRLVSAPYLQALFAAQRVGLDNLLMIVARATHALSAVAVFGWILPDASLAVQLNGFAVSRVTVQLAYVALGVWLAKRHIPELRLDRSAADDGEYRSVRSTLWHSAQVAVLLSSGPQLLALLINLFFGLTYNGIWQIVVQVGGYARMLSEGLLRGIAPLTTHLLERGRLRQVVDLMTRSIRYQFGVILPTVVLLGVYMRPLLELWVGQRLESDPHLSAAGIQPSSALDLAASMALILLAVQSLRAGLFGVERILFGLGKIGSYAWYAKWGMLIVVGSGAALMAWLRQPLVAPVALLAAYLPYSCVLLWAARREVGLPIVATMRRSLVRPLTAAFLFFLLLAPTRLLLDRITVSSFGAVLLGSALANGVLAVTLTAEADERRRVGQLLWNGIRWIRRRWALQRPPSGSS